MLHRPLPAEALYCEWLAEEPGQPCPPLSSYCAQPQCCLSYVGTPSAGKTGFVEKALMKREHEVLEGVVLEGQA